MAIIVEDIEEEDSVQESIEVLLGEYKISLDAANRSRKTISWYFDILNRYFKFLHGNELLVPIQELGTKELTVYLKYLKTASRWSEKGMKDKGPLSPFSIQGKVAAIKAFWSWLLREDHIVTNPLVSFPLPKVPKLMIKILNEEQINKLWKAIDKSKKLGFRIYIITLLLLDTGVRISGLVNIRLSDINFTERIVKVMGKGRKEREIPFSTTTKKELIKYIDRFRPILCHVDSDYLFPKKDGELISVNCVQQAIRRLAIAAGFGETRCHPHIFRHTCATMLLANGCSLAMLQAIMGHESFQTTQKYVHLQMKDLKIQHMRYSPVAKLLGEKEN